MDDIRILLVDDEEEFVQALSERLGLRDLSSQTAFDGEEALRFVDANAPHIMVLDLKMPGTSGLDVLRLVKKQHPALQVIVLTGHGNDLDEAEARSIGIFDYLRKPVDIEVLVGRIRAAYQEGRKGTSLTAAAFAEAGELDTARRILE
ncbi:MAG TPA: response regulator [Anaeromyxobacteraceae bacterium]|nr:response regulator [Anaeromyxobacteraceae bacterium]